MRPETLAPQAPKPCRLAPAAVLSGSDGDLAGSGTDLDVVAALDQVVVGASPVGLPGGPDADVVDGQPGGPAPDADPDGHIGGPDQLEVAGSCTDPNPNDRLRARQLHLEPGGAPGDLQTRELQVREIGRDIGHPHAGLDGPRDPARERDRTAGNVKAGPVLDGHRAAIDPDVGHLA